VQVTGMGSNQRHTQPIKTRQTHQNRPETH